nr:hypothetical protein MFLOJ_25040 [Mycobacterium florentinum]
MIQVTVVPARTVSVAGANAKPSMATWLPLDGAEGAVIDGIAPESGLIVTGACASGREAEHPASKSTPATSNAEGFRYKMAVMPTDRRGGYTG